MRYSTLLLDADMTLLDFDSDESAALNEALASYGIDCNESILSAYHEINKGLWKKFELGEIEKSDIGKNRFTMLLKHIGFDKDGPELNRVYMQRLSFGGRLIDGAEELCSKLHKSGFKLYIITNGTQHIQQSRLQRSGLLEYIDGVFVSEQVGFPKPMKEYFDFVLSSIPEKDKSRILTVGDSLSSDIKGGLNAGLDTCLFAPDESTASSEIKPLYTIKNLSELYSIIE